LDPAVRVEVEFSDVARHALDPARSARAAALPAAFMSRAHLAMPGDLLQLPGGLGVFVLTQRVWSVKSGRPTLKLLLDVLVQDQD
jgi:hypothetical protein